MNATALRLTAQAANLASPALDLAPVALPPLRPGEVVDASTTDIAAEVRALTDGHGADIVFNTVGDPYFQAAHKSLAIEGRQILIAAINRIVEFNIFEFYRGRHTYVGIDTLSLSSVASGAMLQALAPGFTDGFLRPIRSPPCPAISWPTRGRRTRAFWGSPGTGSF